MTQQRLQPIRVLFLDHVPRMSGAEQSLADLVVGLKQGPVEPIVVLPNDGPLAAQLRAHGVLVRMVPMSKRMLETSRATLGRRPFVAIARLFAFFGASFRVWRLMRQTRPAIVHTNTLKSHLIAMLPCAVSRTPLVWHLRDILPKGWLLRAFLVCARFASVIVVPSRAVAEPFKGRRRLLRKLRLIPNGIRVEDFQDARNDRSLREAMDVTANDPVVGIVGRIAPWKGQDVFLRAAAMLAQRHPRAHFAVIGAVLFPENDSAFEQHLHRMTMQLGLEDRVTFLGWQPAPEAMAAIDIFVHASAEPEPFGRAIVEAMASGKPVVAAAGGAVTEIVPPAAGFVVPPSRPELLADALDRLLSDRKLRKRMGDAGAAVAANFFPAQRTVQSVAQLYRSLVQHAMRRAHARRRMMRKVGLDPKRIQKLRRTKAPKTAEQQPMLWPRDGSDAAVAAPQGLRTQGPRAPRPGARTPRTAHRAATQRHSRPRGDFDPRGFDGDGSGGSAVPDQDSVSSAGGGGARAALAARLEVADRADAVALRRSQVRVRTRTPLAPVPDYVPQPAAEPVLTTTSGIYVRKPLYDALKRVMDVALAVVVVVVGLPLWACIAVMIKLESRGPVLFRGTVVGKDCASFTYFKFRSMRIDGDDSAHRKFIERYVKDNGGHEVDGEIVYKLLGDDRVTAVGRWIRKFSLDEIPQLLNILRGQMSFVGPRPPLDYEFDLYDDRAKERMRVLPGITGMQQVWSRHMSSFEDKLRMDMNYMRQRSLWIDIKLILHTIPAAIRGT